MSLMGRVDTMITIPNDKLMNVVERKTTLTEAFRVADDVLRQGVQGISDIITIPGQINVDFADVRAVMTNAGPALMGIGYGVGEDRALQAAQTATSSPLLEQTINGAKGLLVNITSNESLTLAEATKAMEYIHELCDSDDAAIYFGLVVDPEMGDEVRITVLATGFNPMGFANTTVTRTHATQPTYAVVQEPTPASPATEVPEPTTTVSKISPQAEAALKPLVSPKDIWQKAAADRTQNDPEEIFDEADLDIPAFLREKKTKS